MRQDSWNSVLLYSPPLSHLNLAISLTKYICSNRCWFGLLTSLRFLSSVDSCFHSDRLWPISSQLWHLKFYFWLRSADSEFPEALPAFLFAHLVFSSSIGVHTDSSVIRSGSTVSNAVTNPCVQSVDFFIIHSYDVYSTMLIYWNLQTDYESFWDDLGHPNHSTEYSKSTKNDNATQRSGKGSDRKC